MTATPTEAGPAPGALRLTDTFRDAARAAMWPQVERLRAVEPALRDPAAVDELKRYRVATRRLRAAIRVFENALPKGGVASVRDELAELARAVGRVRDLDVRLAGLVEWTAGRGDTGPEAIEPLRSAWAAERTEAAAVMAQRLDSRRHARLLRDLAALVAAPADGDDRPKRGREAVRDRVGSSIWAAFERLRSAVTGLDVTDAEAVHDVRILAKRLRYTIEFLAPVLGTDRDWLVARLVEVQDHLGAQHDADVASAATRAFLDGEPAATAAPQRAAIEAFAADRADAAARYGRSIAKVTAPVTSRAFARRLSQAILGPADGPEPAKP